MTISAVYYEGQIDRDVKAIRCACGGYAERVTATQEEIKKYGCGRPSECCARAFVCCLCGTRLVGTADAPEMEGYDE